MAEEWSEARTAGDDVSDRAFDAALVLDEADLMLGAVRRPDSTSSDELLLTVAEAAGRVRRQLEALEITVAAEISRRSEPGVGEFGLSRRRGHRTPSELLQWSTGEASATVAKRIALGLSITPSHDAVHGESRPAEFAEVGRAVESGLLGADRAQAIVTRLAVLRRRVDAEAIAEVERGLVDTALGRPAASIATAGLPVGPFPADWVAGLAERARDLVDPDGVAPREDEAAAHRGLRLGRERNGLVRVTGHLLAEQAAIVRIALDAGLSPKAAPRFSPAPDDDPDTLLRADEHVAEDPLTRDQRRADLLVAMVEKAARFAGAPAAGGAPPALLVTIDARDLARGEGSAWAAGVDSALSLATAERVGCTGGVEYLIRDARGVPLRLERRARSATAAQRRALMVRDGARCIGPGCSMPAGFADAHHVIPWSRGGPTDVSNLVMLCWWHHQRVHDGSWSLRMRAGLPEAKVRPFGPVDGLIGTGWLDWHRVGHPLAGPPGRCSGPPRSGAG